MSETHQLDYLFADPDMTLALHKCLVTLERIARHSEHREAALLASDCVQDVRAQIHGLRAA